MTISPGYRPASVAPLRVHGRLTPPIADDVLASASVGPFGEAVALWTSPANRKARLDRKTLQPAHRARPVTARVATHGSGANATVAIALRGMASCQVQPLPGGRILVVAQRGGTAVIFDAAGAPVQQGNLRDGIAHVLATPNGRIWVGYSDEGVYGDDRVAHHGIVRFTDDLRPDWLFPHDSGFGPVDDCYTLNVEGETAWACYYNSFPIVRLSGETVTGWRNQITGATGLLVDGDVCALVGGYREDHARVVVGGLDQGQLQPIGQRLLVMPGGQPLPPGIRYLSRGADLHVFIDTVWYRLGLDDLI